MRRSILARFVFIFSFLLIFSVARSAAVQTAPSISGTVTSSADATPIVGATVDVFDANRSFVGSATTDGSGIYTMSNLVPGTFYLRFSASGFVPVAYAGIPCVAQSCFSNGVLGVAPTPVTVTGVSTTTVNVALDRGATISGTITRADDHTPVYGILVRLYDASTSPVATATTGLDGSYSVTGVPFGTYFARTDRSGANVSMLDVLYGGTLCPGGAMPRCRIDSGTPIVVSGSSTTANFVLPRGGTILGALSGGHPGDGPLFNKYPIALYQGTALVATTLASSGGQYGFAGLDPGTYFVRTSVGNGSDVWYSGSPSAVVCVACPGARPGPVTVAVDAITGGINFLLLPSPGSGISGTLTLAPTAQGTQGTGITPDIQIYNSDGTLVQALSTATSGPFGAGTASWSVTGLPPGTYFLRTSSVSAPATAPTRSPSGLWVDQLYGGKDCVAADCDPRQGTPVVVTSNAITPGINFSLPAGSQIGGLLGGSAEIEVYDSRGVRLPQRNGTSGDVGGVFYEVYGLPAGTYYLLGRSTPSVLYSGLPCDGCAVTSGTPVVVTAGGSAIADFHTMSGQKISGTVRSDSATVPANQPLAVISVESYSPNGQLSASATSLADGTYSIGPLAPGTYYLRTRNARGYIDEVYNGQECGACDPVAGTAVVVTSGSDVGGIDFTLSQGQTISGAVIASGGGPLTSAGVLVYAASPSSPAAHVMTDSVGGYSATVPAASYFVQTDPIAGYAQQIYNGVVCPQAVCPTASATAVSVASTPVTGINFSPPACTVASIAPVSLAQAAVGAAYRQTLTVSGASGTAQFTVSSGTLPPGLTLDPTTGVLSGTPTTAGQFTFTVTAVDSSACVSARTYTLDVPPCVVNSAYTTSFTQAVPAVAGAWEFPFTTTCGPLTAASNASWITNVILTFEAHNFAAVPAVGYQTAQNMGGPRQGTITIGSRVLAVVQAGAADTPPFGAVDTPADGSVVSGSVAITGWALGNYVVSDVAIFRDPVAGESSQIFVGYATFVQGARPDVAATYPAVPDNTRAGWGYLLLTNMLPNHGNGTFRFWVYAEAPGPTCFTGGTACVERTLLGTKTINVVNSSATAPFGAIDTPGQGATISGSAFVNFGWALTPQPKTIPFDGSTIEVVIDGVPVGTVTAYNFFRVDVSTLFPGLNNSAGPVGYRVIDTTALSEGLHTIAWLASDDGGVTMGIGSRFFTVQNSAWQPSLRANLAVTPPALTDSELAHADSTTAVPPRVNGVDLGRQVDSLASVPLDATGAQSVAMTNLQVLQLSLNAGSKDPVYDSCPATYAGYLVVNGELAALPVGSSLDPTGTFYWHPGTAFFGTYQLLFVRTSCDRTRQRIPVVVTIR